MDPAAQDQRFSPRKSLDGPGAAAHPAVKQLRAIDALHKNKTINVLGNNEEKTLTQRIRDLNLLHHDLSPSNMVAFHQLPE